MIVGEVLRPHDLAFAGLGDLFVRHPLSLHLGQASNLGCPLLKNCRVDQLVFVCPKDEEPVLVVLIDLLLGEHDGSL